MNYPKTRLRRLRYNKNIRSLFEDVSVSKSDLIQPVFLVDGKNIKKEIKSLSGQFQLSVDNALDFCKNLINQGISSIILFGVSSNKDETGKISCSSESIVPIAIVDANWVNANIMSACIIQYLGWCIETHWLRVQ